MINLKNEKNKSSVIIGRVKRTDNLSRIKKEAAEFLGSRLLSCPRMTMMWILRFVCTPLRMTIPALAFIFTLATTSESSAETWDCGEIANTVSCSLDDNGVFNISGTGKMKDYRGANRPWNSANIQTVTIGTGVTSIGQSAFRGASSLTSITIPEGVTYIGQSAFSGTGLTSITFPDSLTVIGYGAFSSTGLTSITIPEKVTGIGEYAFMNLSSLESIIIQDNINTKNWTSSAFYNLPANAKIVCQGDVEKCKKALAKFGHLIVAADESQCTSTNYYWSGSSCNNKKNGIICAEKWKRNEDFCNRIQYTPAEAAKVLRDDNTNEVTITFRK